MSRDEVVKAAAEAMRQRAYNEADGLVWDFDAIGAAAVDAVWPVIERAVRAQAAAEVRAETVTRADDPLVEGWNAGTENAARIVEGP